MFSWVELVLSNEDEVSSSRTQRHAPGEVDLAIKSLAALLDTLHFSGWKSAILVFFVFV